MSENTYDLLNNDEPLATETVKIYTPVNDALSQKQYVVDSKSVKNLPSYEESQPVGVDTVTEETVQEKLDLSSTSFNNDAIYNFIKEADPTGSKRAEDKSFKVLKDKETQFNPARNNTFSANLDYRSGTSYSIVVPSEYVKAVKTPTVRIKENGTAFFGAYEVDLSTIVKTGETLSIDVHENDNRGIIKSILKALRSYQSPNNHGSGVYSDLRRSFWKLHLNIFDYTGNIKLTGEYICTPKFNIDFMLEYDANKAEDYTLDFKVVNYNIYDDKGNKLI